jgi:hypothetical protein
VAAGGFQPGNDRGAIDDAEYAAAMRRTAGERDRFGAASPRRPPRRFRSAAPEPTAGCRGGAVSICSKFNVAAARRLIVMAEDFRLIASLG